MKLFNFRNLSLQNRLIIYILIILLTGTLTIGLAAYSIAKDSLDEKGRTILKNSVKMAKLLTASYNDQVEEGNLSRAKALDLIKDELIGPLEEDGTREITNRIDLGEHGYFIIYDLEGNEVMHPVLEGENVWDVTDLKDEDFYLVRDQVEKALNGGGYTYYSWEFPNIDDIGRKVTYSEYDPNWDFVITATSYLVDFNAEAYKIIDILVLIVIILLAIGTIVSIIYVSKITAPVDRLIRGMELAENSTYTTIEKTNRNDEINKLIEGFNQMIETIRNRNKNIKEKSDRIHFLAFHDDLTGLPNYNQFKLDVDQFIKNNQKNAYMMQIDVNDLKVINSIMGYNIGNRIIISAAEALEEAFNRDSIVARTSGNEFSILTTEDHRKKFDDFMISFDQMLKAREIYQEIDFHRAVVQYPEDGKSHRELFSKVNVAMRVAKNQHASLITYKPDMKKDINKRVVMVEEIKKGLREKQFKAVYQTKVDKQGAVVGVEGLTRWTSEKLGLIRPDIFIEYINKSNLANQFGKYTLDVMLGDYEALTKKYGQEIKISINISPIFFLSSNFVTIVNQMIKKYNIPPGKVILEITEDVFIKDFDNVREIIDELHENNIEVSLDDFGTGYSSLSYIQRINADELKIDKSFVNEILDNEKKYVLFNSICEIGKAYDYKIVAEGVETSDQFEKIKNTPINYIQGYFYSKPEALK